MFLFFLSLAAFAPESELQARFPRGIGKGSNAAMKFAMSPIQRTRVNARLLRPFGDRLADNGSRVLISAIRNRFGQLFVLRSGRGHGLAARIIDELGINVTVAPKNAQARSRRIAANSLAHAKPPSLPLFANSSFVIHDDPTLLVLSFFVFYLSLPAPCALLYAPTALPALRRTYSST